MQDAVNVSIELAMGIVVILMVTASYRVWRGPTASERLQAIDITTTLFVGNIVLLGLLLDNTFLIDVGIALAAFSFIATLAIARFIAEGKIF
jgi:multicomponent Na+:H+ antiporter subunit F